MVKKIGIVGAGLGGLAAGLRLAHLGHEVTIFEKTDQVGGRNRLVRVNDCEFDAGPTLLMMLDPFRKLFADVGERLEDHLKLQLCDPSYRVFYADGSRLDATTNEETMASQVRAFGGVADAVAYLRLLRDLKDLYKDAIPNFVEKNFYSPRDFFGPAQLKKVAKHRMLANLAKRMRAYFEDPRLRMLFSFQTMYLGLSPFEAPWVYATLTYMEHGEGIWYPKGGIVEIARALARLASIRGAEILLKTPVLSIEGNSVVLESGERYQFDAIVCNADLPYAEKTLLHKPHHPRKYSCSAQMFYIDYEGEIPELLHHNVFFGADFAKNLNQIFHKMEIADDPAFYAGISRRSDPAKASSGHENLYVLVPCPNLDHRWMPRDPETIKSQVFDRLKQETSFDPAKVRDLKSYSPFDWARDLNLDKGAAFGLSHHFRQSAYFRPSNRSKDNPNVYFVGASTVPGNGMPMVLISADLAVDRLRHDGVIE